MQFFCHRFIFKFHFSFVFFVFVLDVVRMLKNYPELDLSVFGLENVKFDAKYDIGDELSRTCNGTYVRAVNSYKKISFSIFLAVKNFYF